MSSRTDRDDYFHPRPVDEPFWNEAGWFSFMVPERDLSGFVYLYHRPNIGYTVGGIAVWDPSGAENYDCLVYDWGEAYQTADGAEMFDFSLGNGLTVELVEPLRHYRFRYRGQTAFNADVALDLDFVADMAPHDAGFPGGLDEWGKGHHDQRGRMTGRLALDGEVIDIDCVAQRDRSWGVRDIVNNPRGQMIWAVGPHSSFHALAVSFVAPQDDPVIGTAEDVITAITCAMADSVISRSPPGTRSRSANGTTPVARGLIALMPSTLWAVGCRPPGGCAMC